MDGQDIITLREHVSLIMKERIRVLNTRLEAMDRALVLAREEMLRRLESLNNLREEVMSDRSQFVHHGVCDKIEQSRTEWREIINIRLRDIEKKVAILDTKIVMWVVAMGIIVGVTSIVLRLVGH